MVEVEVEVTVGEASAAEMPEVVGALQEEIRAEPRAYTISMATTISASISLRRGD
jgi:hypothetical protein